MADDSRQRITVAIDAALAPYLRNFHARAQLVEHIADTFDGALELTDLVLVSAADLDLVMNHAGDPATVVEYPAAALRIQDAIAREVSEGRD